MHVWLVAFRFSPLCQNCQFFKKNGKVPKVVPCGTRVEQEKSSYLGARWARSLILCNHSISQSQTMGLPAIKSSTWSTQRKKVLMSQWTRDLCLIKINDHWLLTRVLRLLTCESQWVQGKLGQSIVGQVHGSQIGETNQGIGSEFLDQIRLELELKWEGTKNLKSLLAPTAFYSLIEHNFTLNRIEATSLIFFLKSSSLSNTRSIFEQSICENLIHLKKLGTI